MKKSLFLFSFLFVIISCQKDNDFINEEAIEPDLVCEGCAISITNDSSRVTQYDQVVNLSSRGNKSSISAKSNKITLRLRATVDPLYIDYNGSRELLNANDVAVNSGRIAASYSLRGEPYSGGVDVLSLPSAGKAKLEGTLVTPDRDIDAISFLGKNNLLFGGGFDARVFYGGDYPSFFGQYKIKYNNKTKVFSLREDYLFHSMFGNKLRSLKYMYGMVSGSGGSNSGIIFAYDEQTNTIIKNNSGETEGLFILDTSIEKRGNKYDFIALAFDNDTKELKAFYYDISKQTNIMNFSYSVSLGTYNLNVEAKHSIAVPKKGKLAVSLGSDGIGLFNIKTDKNQVKYAELSQQIKSEILDPGKPNEVVNSFTYKGGVFYVAAGEAGILIMPYNSKQNIISKNFLQVAFPPNVSVNSIGKSDNKLVVASTLGLSIYTVSGI
jgi:hypothetical protein